MTDEGAEVHCGGVRLDRGEGVGDRQGRVAVGTPDDTRDALADKILRVLPAEDIVVECTAYSVAVNVDEAGGDR